MAAACHRDDLATFKNVTCTIVRGQWKLTLDHATWQKQLPTSRTTQRIAVARSTPQSPVFGTGTVDQQRKLVNAIHGNLTGLIVTLLAQWLGPPEYSPIALNLEHERCSRITLPGQHLWDNDLAPKRRKSFTQTIRDRSVARRSSVQVDPMRRGFAPKLERLAYKRFTSPPAAQQEFALVRPPFVLVGHLNARKLDEIGPCHLGGSRWTAGEGVLLRLGFRSNGTNRLVRGIKSRSFPNRWLSTRGVWNRGVYCRDQRRTDFGWRLETRCNQRQQAQARSRSVTCRFASVLLGFGE